MQKYLQTYILRFPQRKFKWIFDSNFPLFGMFVSLDNAS
jgi:hypothetical protein